MFDTMTMVKTISALCGALLIFLLGAWFSEIVYHPGGGHGDEDHTAGYVIEVDTDDAAAEDVVEVAFADVLASADVGKGEKVFKKCTACHAVEAGVNKVGPYLLGVVGRAPDTADGFAYSGALEAVTDAWTPDALNEFLANPKGYAPGTTMGFAGLKKIEDRAAVVAYLQSLGG